MSKNTVIFLFACVLITSCASNESKSIDYINIEIHSQEDPVHKASLSLGNAISFYKSKNNHFPDSAEELADYLSRYNPSPYFNPQDFKRLEFNHGEDDSLTVRFEVEAGTNGRPGTGRLEYRGDQKKKPNQSSEATLKTPADKVDAPDSQAHP